MTEPSRPSDTLRQGDTDTMVIKESTADTGGAYLEVETTYSAMDGVSPPPPHYHPKQEEHFRVLDGTLSVLLDGEQLTLSAGDELTVSMGQRHTMWNAGPQPVRFRWRTTPALRTESMFRTMWGLVDEGGMGRHGSPRPALLQAMALIWGYRHEWRPTSPPYPITLALAACLSVPARLRGYRDSYPRHNP